MSSRPSVRASTMTVGILLAFLAGTSYAVGGFLANELVDDGTPGVIVGFYEASFGLVFVLAMNVRGLRTGHRMSRNAAGWVLLASIGFATAFGSFYTALSRIDYSVGAPILGAVPLVSYVVLFFVLSGEERITRRALAGATMIVAGVGVIGVAS